MLSPVDICNTSVPMCLDTTAPVPICLTDSSALVPKCLGSELSRVQTPKCLYIAYSPY